ncbi:MAG TPA: hypothetical protein VKK79_04460, partial [Candidatus Lokiarchaeia archaeon]|nr:hypothetical protein [Candidatus Lokiarchaeia archaeon]
VVQDPWGANYTLVNGIFVQGKDTDAYAMTFATPETGTYSFTLAVTGGPDAAVEVLFGITDVGTIQNNHAIVNATAVFTDAHACNATHAAWTYTLSLAGNTTYYLGLARGNPSSAKTNFNITATIQAEGGSEVMVTSNAPLPWGTPANTKGQAMLWASTWFGTASSGSYRLTITTITPPSPPAAIVVTAVSQIALTGLPGNSTNSTTNGTGSGVTIGPQAVTFAAGVSAAGIGVGGLAVTATRRKKKGAAESGQVRRTSPFGEE